MNIKESEINEVAKAHKIKLQELRKVMKYGDWEKVSKKTGIKINTCQQAFARIHSKNHLLVVKALKEVIDERITALQNAL